MFRECFAPLDTVGNGCLRLVLIRLLLPLVLVLGLTAGICLAAEAPAKCTPIDRMLDAVARHERRFGFVDQPAMLGELLAAYLAVDPDAELSDVPRALVIEIDGVLFAMFQQREWFCHPHILAGDTARLRDLVFGDAI